MGTVQDRQSVNINFVHNCKFNPMYHRGEFVESSAKVHLCNNSQSFCIHAGTLHCRVVL